MTTKTRAKKKTAARKPSTKRARKPIAARAAAKVATAYVLPAGRSLMLRTCGPDLRAYGGFLWPSSGLIECPDWNKRAECGNGLHGLLWGEGSVAHLQADEKGRRWLVCEVETASVVDLSGKVKAPRAWVVYCGEQHDAIRMLDQHAPAGTKVVFGTATAGDSGTATAGVRGTATAGYGGTATAGDSGTATAGEYGCVSIGWYDYKRNTHRRTVAEVDGINVKAGKRYRCDEAGKLVEVVS